MSERAVIIRSGHAPVPLTPGEPADSRLIWPEPPPVPTDAPILTKLFRLRHELTAWARAGLPLAPREQRRARLAICQQCEFYAPAGNFGLGECKAPGCGCTRLKLALATSKCPLTPPKWV